MPKYEKLRKGLVFGNYKLIQDLPLKYDQDYSEKDGYTVEKCFFVEEIKEHTLAYNEGTGKEEWVDRPIQAWDFTKQETYQELIRIIGLVFERGQISQESMKYFEKVK